METVALKTINKGTKSEKQESLRLGSSNINVLRAKKILNSVGYSLIENNQFNAAMEAAIKDFQKKSGLTVDGVIGKNTAAKLNQIAKSPVTLLPTITKPASVISRPSAITKPATPPVIIDQPEIIQEGGFNWKRWAMIAIAIGLFLLLGGEK